MLPSRIIGIGETVSDILFKEDVCQQLGNNISDELVATLQNERI